MHRKQRCCLRRDGALNAIDIHIKIRTDINQHRLRAAMNDGRHRRDERMRHRNDFMAGPDAGSQQCEQQGMVPAIHPNGVLHPDELGGVLLEILQLMPVDEVAVGLTVDVCPIDLGLELRVVTTRVDKGNVIGHTYDLLLDTSTFSTAETMSSEPI